MEWLTIIAVAVGLFFGIWVHGKLKDVEAEQLLLQSPPTTFSMYIVN